MVWNMDAFSKLCYCCPYYFFIVTAWICPLNLLAVLTIPPQAAWTRTNSFSAIKFMN